MRQTIFDHFERPKDLALIAIHLTSGERNTQEWFGKAIRQEGAFERIDPPRELGKAMIRSGLLLELGDYRQDALDPDGNNLLVKITPKGMRRVESLFASRGELTAIERLHSINWATWGGLAAIAAAIASTVGSFFAFKAIP